MDRRKLLIGTALAQVVLTGVLAGTPSSTSLAVWLIYTVGALLAAAGALQRPSKEAMEPRTVRHDQIAAASALSSFGMQSGILVGPAIGGVLLATVGIGWCFVVDVAGLLVATCLFLAMRSYPHIGETTPPSLRAIREGITYAAGATRSAGHLPRRHRGDAAGHAGSAVPGAGGGRVRPAGAARPPVHGGDGRRHHRDRHLAAGPGACTITAARS